MGLAPGQPNPSGQYYYPYGGASGSQSVAHQQDWTTATLQSVMKTPVISSFSTAQSTHQTNVTGPINTNTIQISNSGTTVTNHENRILKLENGDQIAIYYSSDTWHKPGGFSYHKVAMVAGGGGGQGGQWTGSQYGGQGGGQGGWYKQVYAVASLTSSAYTVTVGAGGLGAYTSYFDNFARANSVSLGSNWRTDSGTVSGQIINQGVESYTQPANVGENGMWHTYVGGEMVSDNYYVDATIVAPSVALASNNFTGIGVALPTSFSGATKSVWFVGSTGSGCKIITQVNNVSAPYIASGSQTGQASVATSGTNITTSCTMRIMRVGNVFTAYINTGSGWGAALMTWTDSSNTVPTGAGNRHFGLLVEGNHPTFNNEFHSPTINDIQAVDIDGTPGTSSVFTDGTLTITAGGGAAGSVYNAGSSAPAARGSGTETSLNAGGGTGGNGTTYTTTATAGGAGLNAAGGAVVTTAGQHGNDGVNTPPASYGPAGGGSGGGGSATLSGAGGSGGYPGAGGGGGGGGPKPGPGGIGSNGLIWVVSSNSSVF